uniref:hypothetical protein n=1 Tax=Draconibacterium sp. TaxID=1965318 RepID=UPI0035615839
MKQLLCTAFLLVCHFFTASSQENYLNQWPSFRGPFAKGFVENAKTVSSCNIETREKVLWKAPIPGIGHSSPVIWDDKIFNSTA